MQIKTNQIFTLLSIICLILQVRNLFLLKVVQPIGYVINIFMMFPLSFYLHLIICYFIATFLVLNGKKIVGTLILCLNHIEILIIPYMLRYYSMGRADDMSYIGEYLQIANSGYFANWDIYPASHIIGASISMISNLEAHQTSFIIPIVFSFVFITGICLFSRELFSDSCINSLVIISSFILYMGIYNFLNVPHALFFSLMPLYLCFFYRYIKGYNNPSFSIIFVIMTLLIPITHPFIIFFSFIVFLFHRTSEYISNSNKKILDIPTVKTSSFLILTISSISWFIYNETVMKYLRIQYTDFINKITEPVFFETTGKLSKLNFSFLDYIGLLSLYCGRYLIPMLVIIVSLIYLYNDRHLFKKELFKNYPYILFLCIASLFTQSVLLFNPIISHQPDRIMNLNFAVYAQVPLFACALYLLFLKKSKSLSNKLLVCIICSLIWSLSLFGCFDSPNVYRANVALTNNEICGMRWFYELKDESTISVPFSQINRFHAILGDNEKKDRLKNIPDHFGYVNSSGSFTTNLNENLYIIILTVDELLYQEVPSYKVIGRYTKEDFDRFKNDISLNKIYDSVNIEIFRYNS